MSSPTSRRDAESPDPTRVRLQKILSSAGVSSRRAAEALILEGRVKVNGVTVRELGTRADPTSDDIRVDERRVRGIVARRYLLLYKPVGYVSTRHDPEGRPTVLQLVRRFKEYLYPVGRLDYESEGLIILTNDGDLAARLMHPRYGVDRVYEATVAGVPDARALHRLARGVEIEGRPTLPARVRVIRSSADRCTLEIALREGRNRQVRKMCEAIGHPVKQLRRVRIGPIADERLGPGDYRELRGEEVERLRAATERAVARVVASDVDQDDHEEGVDTGRHTDAAILSVSARKAPPAATARRAAPPRQPRRGAAGPKPRREPRRR